MKWSNKSLSIVADHLKLPFLNQETTQIRIGILLTKTPSAQREVKKKTFHSDWFLRLQIVADLSRSTKNQVSKNYNIS